MVHSGPRDGTSRAKGKRSLGPAEARRGLGLCESRARHDRLEVPDCRIERERRVLGVEALRAQVRAWMEGEAEAVEAGELAAKAINNALGAALVVHLNAGAIRGASLLAFEGPNAAGVPQPTRP
jgi:hypothetical protein